MMDKIKELRGVGVNTLAKKQYTDHLAVICHIMNIPLLFTKKEDLDQAVRCYPHLKAQFVELETFTPEFLFTNFDVIFLSDRWDKKSFHERFGDVEKKLGKQMRVVYCPHGFSDKGFFLRLAAYCDIVLTYGQNMLDQLKDQDVLNQMKNYTITGNYRYTYFKQNKDFYENMVSEEVLQKFLKQQPTILYAPTWSDAENSSTFFSHNQQIIGKLPSHYNLIVKPHPQLVFEKPAEYFSIIDRYSGKPNILFLDDFLPVYPLLAHTDIYLGDASSIGYDFLMFNKPMFFLNKHRRDQKSDRGLYLYRCGNEILPDAFDSLYQHIDQHLSDDSSKFGSIRKEVYDYTFGKEMPFHEIKNEIIKAYNKPLRE